MYGNYEALVQACPQATFVDASDLLQEVREVKSDEEVAVLQCSVDLIECGVEAQTFAAQPGVRTTSSGRRRCTRCMHGDRNSRCTSTGLRRRYRAARSRVPTGRALDAGDVIVSEIESSVIGYRAQQIRPIAVRHCDPLMLELAKMHADLYPRPARGLTAGHHRFGADR